MPIATSAVADYKSLATNSRVYSQSCPQDSICRPGPPYRARESPIDSQEALASTVGNPTAVHEPRSYSYHRQPDHPSTRLPSGEQIMAIGDRGLDRRPRSTGRSMSRFIVRESAYWRERAEEARALAAEMSSEYQVKMLTIGEVYDDLARQAERRKRHMPLDSVSAVAPRCS